MILQTSALIGTCKCRQTDQPTDQQNSKPTNQPKDGHYNSNIVTLPKITMPPSELISLRLLCLLSNCIVHFQNPYAVLYIPHYSHLLTQAWGPASRCILELLYIVTYIFGYSFNLVPILLLF